MSGKSSKNIRRAINTMYSEAMEQAFKMINARLSVLPFGKRLKLALNILFAKNLKI